MADYPRSQGTLTGCIGCLVFIALLVLGWVAIFLLAWVFIYVL